MSPIGRSPLPPKWVMSFMDGLYEDQNSISNALK